GALEGRAAATQVGEPALLVALAHEGVERLLHTWRVGSGVERRDERRHLALDLGREEAPGVAAPREADHSSSMPGTASRSMSWKWRTAFSLRLSSPRS